MQIVMHILFGNILASSSFIIYAVCIYSFCTYILSNENITPTEMSLIKLFIHSDVTVN